MASSIVNPYKRRINIYLIYENPQFMQQLICIAIDNDERK